MPLYMILISKHLWRTVSEIEIRQNVDTLDYTVYYKRLFFIWILFISLEGKESSVFCAISFSALAP
jgi:hypothetical protein